MATERGLMMTDWAEYERRHAVPCIIEDEWAGPVDWSGAPPGPDWFFLLSLGHSGSTVLAEILSRHPDIHCASEDQTPLALLGLLTTKTVMSLRGNRALHWQSGPWSGRDQPFACETRTVTAPFLRDLCETWRRHYTPPVGFVGDKHSGYLRRRDELRAVFPGCKFIYTARHPLDQVSGLMHDQWSGNGALQEDARGAWDQVCLYAQTHRELRADPRVLVVHYEDLAEAVGLVRTVGDVVAQIGADPTKLSIAELLPYVKGESVGRWRQDRALLGLLPQWQREGWMNDVQAECLVGGRPWVEAVAEWPPTPSPATTPLPIGEGNDNNGGMEAR